MIEAVQAVVGICSIWLYRNSWCTDTLWIASLRVWIESHTDEYLLFQEMMYYYFELGHS